MYASLDLVLSLLLSPTDNIVESKNDGVAVVVVVDSEALEKSANTESEKNKCVCVCAMRLHFCALC